MGPKRTHEEGNPHKNTVSKDFRMDNATDNRKVALKQYTSQNLKNTEDTLKAIVNKCSTV